MKLRAITSLSKLARSKDRQVGTRRISCGLRTPVVFCRCAPSACFNSGVTRGPQHYALARFGSRFDPPPCLLRAHHHQHSPLWCYTDYDLLTMSSSSGSNRARLGGTLLRGQAYGSSIKRAAVSAVTVDGAAKKLGIGRCQGLTQRRARRVKSHSIRIGRAIAGPHCRFEEELLVRES